MGNTISEPPRLPVSAEQLIGRVLRLVPEQCRYLSAPLTLRVTAVRTDISQWYDGKWVWLEGVELSTDGEPVRPMQVLVAVNALAE
jgi:hypothetical protein